MKRAILLSLFLACSLALSAQDRMITISETELTAIITDEINKAVDEAIRVVVIEYEQKLIDKDLIIVDRTAERDIARIETVKYKRLYEDAIARRQNSILIIIGVGAIGFGAGLLF